MHTADLLTTLPPEHQARAGQNEQLRDTTLTMELEPELRSMHEKQQELTKAKSVYDAELLTLRSTRDQTILLSAVLRALGQALIAEAHLQEARLETD